MADNKYSFIVVKYPSNETGELALAAVMGLSKEKLVKLKDAVAITKSEKGKLKLHQTKDDGARKGLLKGGAIGVLFALLFGPAGWVVAGAALGTAFSMFDRGIKNKLLKELGEKMSPQESALAVLVEQADWDTVFTRMQANNFQGAVVVRELVGDDAAAAFEKYVDVPPPAAEPVPEEVVVPVVVADDAALVEASEEAVPDAPVTGPIQIFYFKFSSVDKLTGQVRKEIMDLRGKGLIRLIDVYAISKAADGTVNRESVTDLSDEGVQTFGTAIKKAMGLDTPDTMTQEEAIDMVGQSLGLTPTDLAKLEAEIKPGEAGLVLMFEHTWAASLRTAFAGAGAQMVMQAMLAPGAVALLGGEVNAILKAQEAINDAEKLRNVARLDALVSMAGAEQIAQLSAARAQEAVASAELIEESTAEDVAEALAAAEMVKTAAMAGAIESAVEAEAIKDAAAEDVADTLETADAIKRAAVADTLRVLIEAGEIEDAAVAHVIATLTEAGMIEEEARERAEAAALTAGD